MPPEQREAEGFRLSFSGNARQIVLLSHGGWTPNYRKKAWLRSRTVHGDGYTLVPKNTTVYFYTQHTVTNVGWKCARAILDLGAQATGGAREEFAPPEKPGGVSDQDYERMIAPLRADFLTNCVQVVETFQSTESRIQVHDYSLEFERRPHEESIWTDHQGGRTWDGSVDLLMLTESAGHTHLSDAIRVAAQLRGGDPYEFFHYAPCRHTAPGTWFGEADLRHT